MALRERERKTYEYGSFKRWANQPAVTSTVVDFYEKCTDEVPSPPPQGNYFRVERLRYWGSVINGGPDPYGEYTYRNSPSSAKVGQLYPNILAPDDAPSLNAMATKLLRDTNPNTPSVDVPAFLRELKDFPRMLQLAGRGFLQKSASANLSYQFGWKPFMGDLVKLLDFQRRVKERVAYLNNLKETGHKAFNRTLYKGSRVSEHHDNGLDIKISQTYNLKIWGFVVWSLDPSTKLPETDEALLRLADRLSHGLSLNMAAVWETLPWSWLIDWFTNVGDILNSQRNLLPMVSSVPQIMVGMRREAFHDEKTFWGGAYHLSQGSFHHETKERFRVTGNTFEAKLPFLTNRQWSILGSLAILGQFPGRK